MRGRIIAGVILLAIGLTWALSYSGITIFPGGFSTWWPSILILLGALRLVLPPRRAASGITFVVLGGVLQLWRLDRLPGLPWAYAGPIALVIVGAVLLASAFRRRRSMRWGEA